MGALGLFLRLKYLKYIPFLSFSHCKIGADSCVNPKHPVGKEIIASYHSTSKAFPWHQHIGNNHFFRCIGITVNEMTYTDTGDNGKWAKIANIQMFKGKCDYVMAVGLTGCKGIMKD